MIYIVCGISGIGKSTYINKIKNDNDIVISRDAIRFSLLKEGEDYFSKEKEVVKIFFDTIREETKNYDNDAYNIYIDATHLTKKVRRRVINNVNTKHKSHISCIYFTPDLNKAVNQNNNRTGRAFVPYTSIKTQYECFETPTKDEGFCEIIEVIN